MSDVWVEPQAVVTVLADEIARSPMHTVALDERGRGLALRFPRVVGFVRDDKSAEDATPTGQLIVPEFFPTPYKLCSICR